jgi:hypothetical protein
MSSVTIGDQKFVKTGGQWIDAKTKQLANKDLLKLLDSMAVDEPEIKKLRINIDRRVEPISISGQKFIYDTNRGWIDEKTKIPAPKSLQLTLSNASPRFGKNDSASIDLTAGFGITGSAAVQKIKRQQTTANKGGGTLVTTKNVTINKPLIAMINQLASIDSYLKQQLKNKQIVAAKNMAQIKESNIENKIIENQAEPTQDATKEPSKLAMIGGLVGLTALLATQFDPIKDALAEVVDFGVSIGGFVSDIAKTLNSGFSWLLSSKDNKRDINDYGPTGQPSAAPQATQQQGVGGGGAASSNIQENTSPTPTGTSNLDWRAWVTTPGKNAIQTKKLASTPSAGSTSSPSMTTTSAAPSTATSSTGVSAGGLKAKGGTPSSQGAAPTTATRTTAPQVSPGGGGKMTQNVGKLFKLGGGVTGNAKNLQNWDPKFESSVVAMLQEYVAAGNAPPIMTSGYRYPGDQAKISTGYSKAKPGSSRHERGLAVDFNSPDVNRMKSMGLLAKYGLSQPMPGKDPVHIQQSGAAAGGTDPIYSATGEDGGVVADLAGPVISAITDTFALGKKLFGKAGAALIGAQNYENMAPLAKAGAIAKTNAMVDSRTPAPPLPTVSPVTLPNINPNKNSPVIESPATSNDMSSVNYYLVRFGFKPAESELTK